MNNAINDISIWYLSILFVLYVCFLGFDDEEDDFGICSTSDDKDAIFSSSEDDEDEDTLEESDNLTWETNVSLTLEEEFVTQPILNLYLRCCCSSISKNSNDKIELKLKLSIAKRMNPVPAPTPAEQAQKPIN